MPRRDAPKLVKPKTTMRKFVVNFEGEVEIEVDDALLRSCNTDGWRAQMMPYTRDAEFVKHIAYNMVVNGLSLNRIDGYADQPAGRVSRVHGNMIDWDIDVTEVKP